MSEENLDDFKGKRKLLKKEQSSVENSIGLKHKSIEKEAENIRELKNIKERMGVISNLYDNANESKILIMSPPEYNGFIYPLEQVTVSGGSIFEIEKESKLRFTQAEEHEAILTATGSTTGSFSSQSLNLVREHPGYFTNPDSIIKKIKVVNELPQQIRYIKSQLPFITPDISEDFDMFLKKYYAFKIDNKKYQDFIALRSTIFLKLIFKPFEGIPGVETKRKKIRYFIFENSTINPAVEPQIEVAYTLWQNLSNQERSVKTGDIDINEVEELFKRSIAVLYSLLKLREQFF